MQSSVRSVAPTLTGLFINSPFKPEQGELLNLNTPGMVSFVDSHAASGNTSHWQSRDSLARHDEDAPHEKWLQGPNRVIEPQ